MRDAGHVHSKFLLALGPGSPVGTYMCGTDLDAEHPTSVIFFHGFSYAAENTKIFIVDAGLAKNDTPRQPLNRGESRAT